MNIRKRIARILTAISTLWVILSVSVLSSVAPLSFHSTSFEGSIQQWAIIVLGPVFLFLVTFYVVEWIIEGFKS
jgi:hypothetical protein